MVKLLKNKHYSNIYFSGCGYMNMFQIGVALCFNDNNITFQDGYSTSAGFVASIATLVCNEKLTQELLLATIKSRFCNSYYFGHNHLSESIKNQTKNILEKYDISNIFDRIHFGARDIKLNNVWFENFQSSEMLYDGILSTVRLLPFISILPYKSNEISLIDQMIVCNIRNILFDVCISPFNFMIMPKAKLVILGDTNIYSLRKILHASLHEMFQEFILGYLTACEYIENPKVRDIYEYSIEIFNLYQKSKCHEIEFIPEIKKNQIEYLYKLGDFRKYLY